MQGQGWGLLRQNHQNRRPIQREDEFDGINAEQLRMPDIKEISYLLFDLMQLLFPLVRTVVVRFKSDNKELEGANEGDVVYHWLGHIN